MIYARLGFTVRKPSGGENEWVASAVAESAIRAIFSTF